MPKIIVFLNHLFLNRLIKMNEKKMNKEKSFFVLLGLFCFSLFSIFLFGCGKGSLEKESAEKNAEPLPPLVKTVEVEPAGETETLIFPGIAKESKKVNLSFRVPGTLSLFNAPVGKRIAKDSVIAKLDSRNYELAVQKLQAEWVGANATLTMMKTGARTEDTATLQTQLEAATTALQTGEANLNRFAALLADGAATQMQYDAVKTQFEAAKSRKESLENELTKAKTGARKEEIEAAEAKIKGLTAQIAAAQNALSDTVLKTPFDGIVVETFVEKDENTAMGKPVCSFADVSEIDVAVNVSETLLTQLNNIVSYQVEFESLSGKLLPASLREIGKVIQPGRQSYPLSVRVNLAPLETEGDTVFPGMTARVHVGLKRKRLYQRIPVSALFGESSRTSVWIVENGKTRRKDVKVVNLIESEAEIEETLPSKTVIVSAGVQHLSDAQNVRILNEKQ